VGRGSSYPTDTRHVPESMRGRCDTSGMDTSNTGNHETMPCHHWVSAVVDAARVSVEEMETYCTRERMHMMFNAGETVWMAADALKHWVRNGKREDRADAETGDLRQAIRASIVGQR
jgi:hypothetical protein